MRFDTVKFNCATQRNCAAQAGGAAREHSAAREHRTREHRTARYGTFRTASLLLVAVGALSGCGGEALDLGGNETSPAAGDADLSGTWAGQLTGVALVGSAKTVQLDLGDGTGTLRVGAEETTDALYPAETRLSMGGTSFDPVLYEGAIYTLDKVSVTGTTLKFSVDPWKLFEPFCAAQTPVHQGSDGLYEYACLPLGGSRAESDGSGVIEHCYWIPPEEPVGPDSGSEVDCMVLYLCNLSLNQCKCDASTCTSEHLWDQRRFDFELQLDEDGRTLEGNYRRWVSGELEEAFELDLLTLTR